MKLDMNLQSFSDINIKVFEKVIKQSLKIDSLHPEKILVIGDVGQESKASPIISSAYYRAARNLGLKTEICIQNHKFSTDYLDVVLAKQLKSLPRNSVIIINVSNKMGKYDSLNLSFRKFCAKYGHRPLSSSGLKNLKVEDINHFISALDVDFKDQHNRGEKIKKELDQAKELIVQTDIGTDLLFDISGRKAINNSGVYDILGKGGNMPAGEVYIPPVETKTNGLLAIDGSLRTWKKTIIPSEPVVVEIKDGVISKIRNSQMSKLLKDTIAWSVRRSKFHPEYSRTVSEFGLGTNKNAKLIGTTIIDEKKYGTAHVAFGSNAWFGGKIKCRTHFDQVFKKPTLRIDGKLFRT